MKPVAITSCSQLHEESAVLLASGRDFVIAKVGGDAKHTGMNTHRPDRSPAFLTPFACLLALCGIGLFSSCVGTGRKGHSGIVVSSADPALVANAGRVDMTLAEPEADYASNLVEEYLEPVLEPVLDSVGGNVETLEEVVRTEITPASGEYKEYVVRKGDSLTSISRDFDTSIASLKRANGMSGDDLIAGKTLRIPAADGASEDAAATSPTEESSEDSSEVMATVPKGEDAALGEIAGEEELPETLPSGVVPPAPPKRPSLATPEDGIAPETSLPVKRAETTIGDDGFLRFDDE